MKKMTCYFFLLCLPDFSTAQDTWSQQESIENGRAGAVAFSVGTKCYAGLGFHPCGSCNTQDFWEYDTESDTWTQKADFPGLNRNHSSCFAIGSKGYVGMGVNFPEGGGNGIPKKDFWEYDPITNVWSRKADFGGAERFRAVGFVAGNKGYIGTGYDSSGEETNDFWEYNPETDVWSKKMNFPGEPRYSAVGFSIAGRGYMGTGSNGGSEAVFNDFWEYNPTTDNWKRLSDLTFQGRLGTVGFAIGSKGYIGTGWDIYQELFFNDFWEYNPKSDSWIQKANFGGIARSYASGVGTSNNGFLGFGNSSNYDYFQDWWKYIPDSIEDCKPPFNLAVIPIRYNSVKLKWNSPTEPVASFKIRYRAVGISTLTRRTVKGSSNHILICDLTPNTTYEWQIKSNCIEDTSSWVRGPDFKTASSFAFSGTANNIYSGPGNAGLQIIPNPIKSNFTLQMQLSEKESPTTLSLYDGLGQRVWQQSLGSVKGQVIRNITMGNTLSSGIYTLKVERSDVQLMLKVVVN